MSSSRVLPDNLKGQSTRLDRDWHNVMMAKFNKLNDEFNKRSEGEFNKDISIVNTDVLNFNEDNVFDMIKRAKEDIKTINKNNTDLNKQINDYDECKKECISLIEGIQQISDLYYKLSTKSQFFDVYNKLEFKQQLIDVETSSKIDLFNSDIKLKLDELHEHLTFNKKKLSDFKKLVSTCIDDTEKEKDKNMCNICVSRKINTCLNPCGHTFCLTCVDKMHNKCGMCRTTFISKIKMYIVNDETEDSDVEEPTNETPLVDGFSGFDSTSSLSSIINIAGYIQY